MSRNLEIRINLENEMLPLRILKAPFKYLAFLSVIFILLTLLGAQVNPNIQRQLNQIAKNIGVSLVAHQVATSAEMAKTLLESQNRKANDLELDNRKLTKANQLLTSENGTLRTRHMQHVSQIESFENERIHRANRLRAARIELQAVSNKMKARGSWQVVRAGATEVVAWVPLVGDLVSVGAAGAAAYDTCVLFKEIKVVGEKYGLPIDFYSGTGCQNLLLAVSSAAERTRELKEQATRLGDVIVISAQDRRQSTTDAISRLIESILD